MLGTSRAIRRPLPLRLVVSRAERRGRELWDSDPDERQRALAAMEAVVGGTTRAEEVEALARQHVIEGKVNEAFFWQPWPVPQVDDASAARLRQAVSSGTGTLLSTCHMGPYLLGLSALIALGRTIHSVSGPWVFQTPTPGAWGRRIARRRSEARARGERLVYSVGSFEVIRTLLEERELVSIYFSVPGNRATRFLGKPVMLAAGTARLSFLTGASIVPLRMRRDGHELWLDVGSTLDPGDFGDVDELHDALAVVHGAWMLELPATVEDPNREGSWERSATAEGWTHGEREPTPV
jgi:lauroyl/myristoyl acyltransferase